MAKEAGLRVKVDVHCWSVRAGIHYGFRPKRLSRRLKPQVSAERNEGLYSPLPFIL